MQRFGLTVGGLAILVCLLACCSGDTESNVAPESGPPPLPEFIEVRFEGPTKWEARFNEGDISEYYYFTATGHFAPKEPLMNYHYAVTRGRRTSMGGGGYESSTPHRVQVGEQSTLFFTTCGVAQFGMTRPYKIELAAGKNVVDPNQVVRLEVVPAAEIKLTVKSGPAARDAKYAIELMDGTLLYEVPAAADDWRPPRMVPADEKITVRHITGPQQTESESLVVGPFVHGSRNEVILSPTKNDGD
jgi:hypothetical protein